MTRVTHRIVIFLIYFLGGKVASGAVSKDGHCIWYGLGEKNPDKEDTIIGDNTLNIYDSDPPRELTNPLSIARLDEHCMGMMNEIRGEYDGKIFTCCDEGNIEVLTSQITQIDRFLQRCGACVNNMKANFCYMTCHPHHSEFLVPTDFYIDSVKSIDYYIDPAFVNDTYNSCDEVYYPELNTEAIFLFCGSYGTDCTPQRLFDYLGDNDFAPFLINYIYTADEVETSDGNGDPVTVTGLEITGIPCNSNDTAMRCSCADCRDSCGTFPEIEPPKEYEMVGELRLYELIVIVIWAALSSLLIVYFLIFKKDDKEEKYGILTYNHKYSAELEQYLRNKFRLFALAVTKRPYLTITGCAIIISALSAGNIYLDMTADPVELWASPESRTRQEKDYFDEHFGPFYRTTQVIATPVGFSSFNATIESGLTGMESESRIFGPILHKEFLFAVMDLQNQILEITANYEGKEITINEVCIKPMEPANEECLLQNIPNYWQNNRTKLEIMTANDSTEYLSWFRTCTNNPTFTTVATSCLGTYGGPILPYVALGGFLAEGEILADNPNYDIATAVSLTFLLQNYVDETDIEPALEWEEKFLDFIDRYSNEYIDLAYYSERSVEDEIIREGKSDAGTIIISYVIMFVYVTIALGKYTTFSNVWVEAKITLGLAGVFIVLLSVIASMGFYGYVGVQSTIFVLEVVPFLVLAIGVDNLFLMVQSWQRMERGPDESTVEHVARAVGQVAPSILITTTSEAVCFFLGAMSDMPAVYSFALCAGLALVINFALQLTCFVALLSLDAKRMESNRCDILCCIKKTKDVGGKSNTDMGLFYKLFKRAYGPFITHKITQLIVIIIFVGGFLFSAALTPKMKIGLEQDIAFTNDSYLIKYFDFLGKYLSVGTPVYFVVDEGFDYTEVGEQNLFCSSSGCHDNSILTQIVVSADYPEQSKIATGAQSWLESYIAWISDRGARSIGNPMYRFQTACCRLDRNGTFIDSSEPIDEDARRFCLKNDAFSEEPFDDRPLPENFMEYLPKFLIDNPHDVLCTQAGHPAYGAAVNILGEAGTNSSSVGANHYMAYHTLLKTSDDYTSALEMAYLLTDTMNEFLEQNSNSSATIFPYSLTYVYYEQYLTMWKSVGTILGSSIAAVIIIMFLLTGLDLVTTAINSLIIIMIVVDIMACMYGWNIDLNAVSLVNLVMSVGISVEFCSHFTHAFNLLTEGTRKDRTIEALATTGTSILSGITLTKFGGIAVLAFANSEIFIIYYFRMFLLMVLMGVAHGLIFLPVITSIFGHPVNTFIKDQRIIDDAIKNEMEEEATENGYPLKANGHSAAPNGLIIKANGHGPKMASNGHILTGNGHVNHTYTDDF